MIIGIIPKVSSIETLLNNLSEADFSLSDVSVILRDQKKRDAVADDVGPLKGTAPANLVAKLTQLGISKQDAQTYSNAVAKNQALVAMNVPQGSEDSAVEMLKDYAQNIKVAG
jgi:hypothetical protein